MVPARVAPEPVLLLRRRLRRSHDEVVCGGRPVDRVLRAHPHAGGHRTAPCGGAERARDPHGSEGSVPPISSPPVTPELDPERLGDHLDRLYRAAWGLCGSREDAEDLVQETYARVLRRPRMLRRDEDLAYLLRVLRNTFLNTRRTASRRPQQAAMPVDAPFAEPRGTVQPDTAAEASEVFAAIATLPEDFRDVLVAVDVVGLSYAEAGRAFKLKEATVTSRLYRARERVAKAVRA